MPGCLRVIIYTHREDSLRLHKIMDIVKKSEKYKLLLKYENELKDILDVIRKEKKAGKGYREIIKQPIANDAGSDNLIKRLFILLASVNAGNTNKDILNEYTTILDKLIDRNKIDTFLYRVFLKK